MDQGKVNGYICQGFNPLAALPEQEPTSRAALAKLKFLVIMDPLATETSEFWQNYGEYNDVDPAKIQTEVFRLPTTCFAEEDGSLVNSAPLAAMALEGRPSRRARRGPTSSIMSSLHHAHCASCTQRRAARSPTRSSTCDVALHDPRRARTGGNGEGVQRPRAGRPDRPDGPDQGRCARPANSWPASAQLRDDGTTASGCWIFSGSWTEAGNQMARRDNTDPTGIGNTLELGLGLAGQPAHPLQPRLVRSGGQAVEPEAPARHVERQGLGRRRRARHRADAGARDRRRPVHHEPPKAWRGCSRASGMNEGPFPEHYEPFETPLGNNPLHPNNPKATTTRPRACSRTIWDTFGKRERVPATSATTYRLTEHFHYWTKHSQLNAIIQPEQFVEIGEELAQDKGIAHGDRVQGQLQARLHQGRGRGDQAHQAAARSRARRCTRSACRSTGASRG